MADLVKEGKIRHIGLSGSICSRRCAGPARYIRSLPCRRNIRYGAAGRRPGILHTCRELGVGFVPYSPLGRGFLTRTITDPGVLAADDFRRHLPRFQGETMRKNQLLLERLQQVATRYDATLAQIALA